jgi:hypothetical protein
MRVFKFVTSVEFDEFLRAYPRALEPHPPLDRKALFRHWLDPALGKFPANVVAVSNVSRRSRIYEVRGEGMDQTR